MKTWIWISLYIIQTLVGAVYMRKVLVYNKHNDGFVSFILSSLVIINVVFLIAYFCDLISIFIDFLAGVKTKTEEK